MTTTTSTELIKYKARDGQEISLAFDIVRKYLVSENRELVTDQEIFYFINICKAKGLNPLKKDCYLIKYSNDPAAIVVSIDYFRSRAKAQKDCKGWKKGIIVKDSKGNIKDSCGLMLDEEKLLGGFFEAQPEGWEFPLRLEVNLRGYIKRKSSGEITKFWQPENQPTQIMKVAESQGLRTVWPDEFDKLYTDVEIQDGMMPTIDIPPDIDGNNQEEASFDEYIRENYPDIDQKMLEKFVVECAKTGNCTVDEIKSRGLKKVDAFMSTFEKFEAKQKAEKSKRKKPVKPDDKPEQMPISQTESKKENDPVYANLKYELENFTDIFKATAKELKFPEEFLIDELPLDLALLLHKAISEKVDAAKY